MVNVNSCSNSSGLTATASRECPFQNKGWTKTGCLVLWIEWSGSHRSPVANLCLQENCTVEYTGRSDHLVTLPDGQKIVHPDGDYGFEVIGGTLV